MFSWNLKGNAISRKNKILSWLASKIFSADPLLKSIYSPRRRVEMIMMMIFGFRTFLQGILRTFSFTKTNGLVHIGNSSFFYGKLIQICQIFLGGFREKLYENIISPWRISRFDGKKGHQKSNHFQTKFMEKFRQHRVEKRESYSYQKKFVKLM